ncbi:MAG: cation:proton antiporter [Alphaproteobacteria bacterium]|nr:cation:proton antiporter [Alphaproteobacteria bacterium]
MDALPLVAIAAAILGFGLVSRRLEAGLVTPPMAFTGVGILCGAAALGLGGFEAERTFIHVLAELTLVMILFTDASRIDLRVLARERGLPLRLLGIGLPLTILLGAGVGVLIGVGVTIWEAALVAAVLAPTDAALGMAVVSNERVPLRIRQALNVESGLNDGIALPVVLIFLSIADVTSAHGSQPAEYWVRFVALQVTLGPLAGLAVGWLGGRLVQAAWDKGWMEPVFLRLSAIGLALLAFAGAELVHGNGFIAAFVAGLALGNFTRGICEPIHRFGETEGQLMTLLTFLVFGAVMVPAALPHLDARILLYALLSLTAIRMVPVALSLIGTGLRLPSVLFLGWFGPRGIASILFALVVLEGSDAVSATDIAVVTVTVLLSVLAHGITAAPFAGAYGAACARFAHIADHAEHQEVTPMRLRHARGAASVRER